MAEDWKVLNDKLNLLIREQERFQKEIFLLKTKIDELQVNEQTISNATVQLEEQDLNQHNIPSSTTIEKKEPIQTPKSIPSKNISPIVNWEKFIGENLISKIGISILVIGVGIGVKFAIDHELISPLTRIILGYLLGFGLLALAFKLKEKYLQFSAVLLSGSMAINYFLTYAAFSLYDLFPQFVAFGIMLIFTIFTVFAALKYNLQIIAHFGLVGAYAVPFLLSNGSGRVGILFSYMALINLGILFISYKRYWKNLFFAAFALTWIIFASWYFLSYEQIMHQWLAFSFATIFYLTFYGMFILYNLRANEKFEPKLVLFILSNSFIYFGFGYAILDSSYSTNDFLGLFTVLNAIIHFSVLYYIKSNNLADKNLLVLLLGLVLVFISIAIPIQLDGNWVTLCWVGESALLFWLGRTKSIKIYEQLSYAVMVLFMFSMLQDWVTYTNKIRVEPGSVGLVFNIYFLVGLFASGLLTFIQITQIRKNNDAILVHEYRMLRNIFIPGILLLVSFTTVAMEIVNYWNSTMYLFLQKYLEINSNSILNPMIDALRFKNIWLINFAAFYFSLLSLAAIKFIFKTNFKLFLISINVLVCLLFLSVSLFEFSEIRTSYLLRYGPSDHVYLPFSLTIRYISFGFIFPSLYYIYKLCSLDDVLIVVKRASSLFIHLFVLWLLSSEMLHLMDLLQIEGSYKLSLSILWGLYSLFLVFIGIIKSIKDFRFAAITLFAITLLKLFIYDMSGLNTIGKTIVFVSLGILLLIISFLYNKNKSTLFNEDK